MFLYNFPTGKFWSKCEGYTKITFHILKKKALNTNDFLTDKSKEIDNYHNTNHILRNQNLCTVNRLNSSNYVMLFI